MDALKQDLKHISQANLLGTVRKISVSALLNDRYEGGELAFRYLNDQAELVEQRLACKQGDVIIFPSYLDHKVYPVTKGIRYSVVAWFGGPPFK